MICLYLLQFLPDPPYPPNFMFFFILFQTRINSNNPQRKNNQNRQKEREKERKKSFTKQRMHLNRGGRVKSALHSTDLK